MTEAQTDRGVKLYTETTVDLNLASVVHPGNPELDKTLRLHDAVDDTGFNNGRIFLNNNFQRFQYFPNCLQEFLFTLVAFNNGVVNRLQVLIF